VVAVDCSHNASLGPSSARFYAESAGDRLLARYSPNPTGDNTRAFRETGIFTLSLVIIRFFLTIRRPIKSGQHQLNRSRYRNCDRSDADAIGPSTRNSSGRPIDNRIEGTQRGLSGSGSLTHDRGGVDISGLKPEPIELNVATLQSDLSICLPFDRNDGCSSRADCGSIPVCPYGRLQRPSNPKISS